MLCTAGSAARAEALRVDLQDHRVEGNLHATEHRLAEAGQERILLCVDGAEGLALRARASARRRYFADRIGRKTNDHLQRAGGREK
jgi:hypothetical protein